MKKATGAEFPGHKGVNSRSHVRKPVREYNDWQLKTNQPKQSSKSDGYQISIIDKPSSYGINFTFAFSFAKS